MKRLNPPHKAPLALAAVLALPIFFASLMAVSLAIEKAKAYEWMRRGRLIRVFHDPPPSLEAKIWLLSFAPPLLLVLIGLAASHLRKSGMYVVCVAAVVDALALTIRLGRWERHHTARFPFGEDLYPDSSNSSLTSRGQWEHNAVHTVHTLIGYTIALAVAAAVIGVLLEWRHGRGGGDVPFMGGSELQQTGGAPTTTGL